LAMAARATFFCLAGVVLAARAARIAENTEAESSAESQASRVRPAHLAELAARGEDLESWRSAVLRNAGAVQSGSLLEDNGQEASTRSEASASPTWPTPWAKKLEPQAAVAGQGAFGKVYVATVQCDGTQVAVKEMKCTQTEADQEARLLQTFSFSPHFAAYFDHQKSGSKHFIMMEAALGKTLAHIVDGRMWADYSIKMQLFYQMLRGVKQMHDLNIVHRDLKPANVFVSRKCSGDVPCAAKVGDLGLSCLMKGSPKVKGIPVCGSSIAGTPLYIAPETYKSSVTSPLNDVWALGLMLYELRFDKLPSVLESSRSLEELERRVVNFDISADGLFGSLSPSSSTRELLLGMLSRKTSSRWSSSRALSYMEGHITSTSPPAVAALPDCWSTGRKPVSKPTTPLDAVVPADELVDFFKVTSVKTNIKINNLFNNELVDASGLVVGCDKLEFLHKRGYFPKKLRCGDRILEVNNMPWSRAGKEASKFKTGMYGDALIFMFEKA